MADISKIEDALLNLAKVLNDEGIIKGKKWHTVEFYIRSAGKKKGFLVDELRTSSTKRELEGIRLEEIGIPRLLLQGGLKW